jgi:hypothetical protein
MSSCAVLAGSAAPIQGWFLLKKTKKEEFLGAMLNMAAGNSFPQICVVSETYSARNLSR